MGFVPQSHATDHPFTVLDMVLMGRAAKVRAWSVPNAQDDAAAWAALDRVGMAEQAAAFYTDLSGGQRQWVLMARALECDPAIPLLEQPTYRLQPTNQKHEHPVLRTTRENAQ